MMPPKDRFPNLCYLLSAYFHQDWYDESGDEATAVKAFVKDVGISDAILTIQEIERVKLEFRDAGDLPETFIDDMMSSYYYQYVCGRPR